MIKLPGIESEIANKDVIFCTRINTEGKVEFDIIYIVSVGSQKCKKLVSFILGRDTRYPSSTIILDSIEQELNRNDIVIRLDEEREYIHINNLQITGCYYNV